MIEIHAGGGNDNINAPGNVAAFGDEGDDRFFLVGSISEGKTSGSVDGGTGVDTIQTNISFVVDLLQGTAKAFDSIYTVTGIENVELTAYYGAATQA